MTQHPAALQHPPAPVSQPQNHGLLPTVATGLTEQDRRRVEDAPRPVRIRQYPGHVRLRQAFLPETDRTRQPDGNRLTDDLRATDAEDGLPGSPHRPVGIKPGDPPDRDGRRIPPGQ